MHTPVKNFRISAQGFYRSQKQLKSVLSRGACDKATAQIAQFWAMGITSEISRHPKDVPFVCEFWWGMTVWAL